VFCSSSMRKTSFLHVNNKLLLHSWRAAPFIFWQQILWACVCTKFSPSCEVWDSHEGEYYPCGCTRISHERFCLYTGNGSYCGNVCLMYVADQIFPTSKLYFQCVTASTVYCRQLTVYYGVRCMIYLLTASGEPPGGSSTVPIYTQRIHRTTQNKQYV